MVSKEFDENLTNKKKTGANLHLIPLTTQISGKHQETKSMQRKTMKKDKLNQTSQHVEIKVEKKWV